MRFKKSSALQPASSVSACPEHGIVCVPVGLHALLPHLHQQLLRHVQPSALLAGADHGSAEDNVRTDRRSLRLSKQAQSHPPPARVLTGTDCGSVAMQVRTHGTPFHVSQQAQRNAPSRSIRAGTDQQRIGHNAHVEASPADQLVE
eukprot:CAMPEP_0168462524 /NCGR_PEP_ID=MMETSP0228-20121227/54565_1 /TAXON_ID=133427 /ORGANISM="Protoceratium reticulatum, Strain CCCM 535 (=CCMP 1889)" /LENGTH=145 /DNA_ID=CAMNT_0008477913 /DNA_START=452 /DNA_END=888 /DNA_ORIENTATION=+